MTGKGTIPHEYILLSEYGGSGDTYIDAYIESSQTSTSTCLFNNANVGIRPLVRLKGSVLVVKGDKNWTISED